MNSKAVRLLWLLPFAVRRYDRCIHRSHRLGLRCRRYLRYDGYCGKHNSTCWTSCDPQREGGSADEQ